jgi:parvulin-like peptidyl-prolyl isomerase
MFQVFRFWAIAVLILPVLVLVLAGSCQRTPVEEKPPSVLVRVNGDPITEDAVLRRIRSDHGEVTGENMDPGTWQRLTEAAIESEILDLLLFQAAQKEGFSVSPDLVDRDMNRTREIMGEGAYREMLGKRSADEEQFRQYLAERILITRMKEKLFGEIDLSEEQVEAYYEGHPERFALREQYRLHILVYNSPEEAGAARDRVERGEPFDSIAREHAAAGGEASRTRPMPADALPVGMREVVTASAVDSVIRYDGTDSSYLIRILEKSEGGGRSFEEAREDVKDYLRELRRQKLLGNWYEAQVRQAKIEYIREQKD